VRVHRSAHGRVGWRTAARVGCSAAGLAALRQAAALTQAELARRLGVTQAAISRIEQPHDLLLSTLNSYLGAIGGRASVIVTFADGHETTLDLSQLT
jgi:transcriptional regulator with XRE-family HTH domain